MPDDGGNKLEIAYDVTAAEVRAGERLLIAPTQLRPGSVARKPSVANGLLGWLLFIVLAVALFLLLHNPPPQRPGARRGAAPPVSGRVAIRSQEIRWDAANVVAAACGVAVIATLPLMSITRRSAKAVRPGSQTFSFDADGITRRGEQEWRRWPWAALHSFAETDDLFVVRLARDRGLMFPKRLLGRPGEVELLRAILAERLVIPAQPAGQALDYAVS